MKRLLFIAPLFFFGFLHGQLEPMFSHYMFSGLNINPAYAGSREQATITTIGRKQWLGINNSPATFYFGGHAPSADLEHGFGVTILRDAIGFTDMTNLNLNYAYRIQAGKHRIALGLLGGVHHFHSNLLIIKTKTLGDPAYFFNQVNRWLPNVGTGVYVSSTNYFAGISIPNILTGRLNPGDRPDLQARRYLYMNFTGGYIFDLKNGAKFRPSFLARHAPGISPSVDLSASFFFRDRIWFGASYRYKDSYVFFTEIQLDQWRIGYSYDLPRSALSAFTSGSHEIMLSFDIGFTKDNKASPRYF